MKKAYTYLQSNYLMKAKDYPYEAKQGKCRYDQSKGVIKATSYEIIEKDEEVMKKILYKYGPISSSINAYGIAFYDKGVFEPWISILCPPMINHAITIVGYGIDKETGKKFWRIKNSMGQDWGEDGYFRILRGENVCGINKYTLIADIEKLN